MSEPTPEPGDISGGPTRRKEWELRNLNLPSDNTLYVVASETEIFYDEAAIALSNWYGVNGQESATPKFVRIRFEDYCKPA